MTSRRDEIVAVARGWIGTPYRHQASLRGVGCDCLGLLRGVWREIMGKEPEVAPPYTRDWAEAQGGDFLLDAAHRWFRPVPQGEFSAGDVLVFRWKSGAPVKHCAIATSPDSMIHAHDGASVCEIDLSFWRRRLVGAFSFPEREAQ